MLPGRLFLCWRLLSTLLLGSCGISLLEDVKCQTLALLKDFVNQVFMAMSSLQEVDDLLSVVVDMGPVVISVLDGLLGCDQLSNVDRR